MNTSETVYVYAADEINTDFTSTIATIEELPQVTQNSDTGKILTNQTEIQENQKQIIMNQTLIIENQNKYLNNQKNTTMTIAEMSVKLDRIIIKMNASEVTTLNQTMKKSLENSSFCFKPIRSVSELSHLEDVLGDENIKAEYKAKYSIVCEAGKAANCAYQLCDVFFSRDFLTKCSWSGSTRGEGTKVSLKMYKNFLNFFFELVYDCDKSYTISANEKFFKSILKNSTKRKLSKLQRSSTCRNSHKRQKRTEEEKTKDTTDNDKANEQKEDDVLNNNNLPQEDNLSNEKNARNVDDEVNENNPREEDEVPQSV